VVSALVCVCVMQKMFRALSGQNTYECDLGGTGLGELGGPAPLCCTLHSPDCTSDMKYATNNTTYSRTAFTE